MAMRIWRLAGKGVDGGRTGVARGGADDGHLLATPRQDLVEHRGQELHREVLEGQGRPMEQLEQPVVAGEMAQGRGGGMVEIGIGAPGQPQQIGLVEAANGEGRQQPGGERRVVEPAHGAQLVGREGRPALGHEQPAILGEPGQQHLLEAAPPGLAARADVMDHRGSVMAGGT